MDLLKNKIKLVVSDIDGTLFNHNHRLSKKTAEAVRRLVEKGYIFALASGRNIHDAQMITKEIGVNAYAISSNGATIADQDGSLLCDLNIEPEIVRELLQIPKINGVHINMYQGRNWFIDEEEKVFSAFYQDGYLLPKVAKLMDYSGGRTDKVFFTSLDTDKLLAIKDEIDKSFKGRVASTFSMSKCLEITHKNANKGNALKKLSEHIGIDVSETMVFGDGLNDIEMLNIAGKSYLMGNCSQMVRDVVSGIEIIAPNSEDGVAQKLIEVFGLDD